MLKSKAAHPWLFASVVVVVLVCLADRLAASDCLRMPFDRDDSPIMVCSSPDGYLFRRGPDEDFYPKEEFERQAQQLLERWFADNGLDVNRLCGGVLSLWLAVPESDPLGVQLRLSAEAIDEPFVIFLPWLPSEWVVDTAHAAILGSLTYPGTYGYRAASLLVKRAHGVSTPALHAYLAGFGLQAVGAVSGDWWAYRMLPLHERATLARLQGDLLFPFFGEDATLNPILEWTAQRRRAFSFPLTCRAEETSPQRAQVHRQGEMSE